MGWYYHLGQKRGFLRLHDEENDSVGPESPAAENQLIKEPLVHLLEQLVGLTVENVG